VKLFGVKGKKLCPGEETAETQDLLMTTSRSAFLNTAETAAGFFKAVKGGGFSLTKFLATHPITALEYARLGIDGTGMLNVLSHDYWSQAPIRYGNTAAKFKVTPCSTSSNKLLNTKLRSTTDLTNFLRTNLQKNINQTFACFDFQVQLYQNDVTTPLEDATVEWPTPFVTVGTIEIPPQWVWSDGQDSFCRYMAFNPWHSIQDHEPLGMLQRLRKIIYLQDAKQRHNFNGQTHAEVTKKDWVKFPKM